MKHSLIFLILLFITFSGFGQAKITLGKPYAVVDAGEKFYFRQGNEILVVKVDGKTIILQKFLASDLTFKQVKVYKNILEDYTLEKVTKFQDKYYIFYSNWDKTKEKEQLFCKEIDFNTGVFKGEQRKVLQANGKISGSPLGSVGFWSFGVQDKFDFYFSYDSSKMFVQYRRRPEVKKDANSFDIIGMGVYDKYIDEQWNEEVTMPYTEKKMNNIDYSIDSEGNAYILSTVYEDNTTDIKKSKNGKANYHIELIRVAAQTAKMTITPVSITDKFINKIWLYESPKNEMICAGFYNKGKNLDAADGIILFKIKKEGKLSDLATYEIPLEY